MAEIKLNNSDAFRFLNIKAIPILVKVVESNGCKYVKSNSSSDKKIFDIIFKFKDENKTLITTSPTMYYPNFDSIAISLHKMMHSKNILFIKEDKVYIISVEKLWTIWNNSEICSIDKKSYQDGLGEKAQLSRVNIDWMAENADKIFEIPSELKTKYYSEIYNLTF